MRLWWTGCIWQEFVKALTKRWGGLRRVPCSKVGSPRLCLLLQGGHRNYDSFVRALFVDLASLISSLSHRLGQIWVKAQGNDGSTGEAKWRNCKRSICCHWQNFVGHNAVCSHENMYSPLINISCSLFLWQIWATTISLIFVKRDNLPSVQGAKLVLLTCFSQSRFQNSCALCVSACPHLPLPHV